MAVAETAVAYDTLGLFFAVLEAAARFPAWCHCGMVFFFFRFLWFSQEISGKKAVVLVKVPGWFLALEQWVVEE